MMDYYKFIVDICFLLGIFVVICFLELMKLLELDVKKWKSQLINLEVILVFCFVDFDIGKLLYVYCKGSNVKNGIYYIDQNIENIIVYYNLVIFVNLGELCCCYEEVKKFFVFELVKNLFLLQDYLVFLFKYYICLCGKVMEEVVWKLVKLLIKDGCWFFFLKLILNLYKLYIVLGFSEEMKYIVIFVGDEYDILFYLCIIGELCIFVGDYIDNMIKLISYFEK